MKPEIMGFYESSVDLMNNRVSSESETNRSLSVGLHANQASGQRDCMKFSL